MTMERPTRNRDASRIFAAISEQEAAMARLREDEPDFTREEPVELKVVPAEPTISEEEAMALVEENLLDICVEYPDLNSCGYGRPYSHYYKRHPTLDEQCHVRWLFTHKAEIAACIRWLSCPDRVVLPKFTQNNTYGLKHRMEDQTGQYVGNSEMIAAFLILGLPIDLDDYNPRVLVVA